MKYGPDRQRGLEHDCLEISANYGRSAPLGFGLFLIRVGICLGRSVSADEANYIPPEESTPRATAETGTRLSGGYQLLLAHPRR